MQELYSSKEAHAQSSVRVEILIIVTGDCLDPFLTILPGERFDSFLKPLPKAHLFQKAVEEGGRVMVRHIVAE